MPELAEVEYYRKRWNPGLGLRVRSVSLHPQKRIFRQTDTRLLESALTGARLIHSETRGKQMLFRFSKGGWLGLHLGMTGKLWVGTHDFEATQHDHLVLSQSNQALVYTDPRQFGRVLFHHGSEAPEWWSRLPPDVVSPDFTVAVVEEALRRHRQAPIKAVLLNQVRFPGLGNWMVDEILWRAGIDPRLRAGRLGEDAAETLWREIRFVSHEAMKIVGKDFSDPPRSWFYHQRWDGRGRCPKHREPLSRGNVGGRTTAWCPRCQPRNRKSR